MGSLVCALGWGCFALQQHACYPCTTSACYAAVQADGLRWDTLSAVNLWPLVIYAALSGVMVLLFLMKPLQFWKKSAQVFAMLFPLLAFHLTFTCAKLHSGLALEAPTSDTVSVKNAAIALALSAVATGVGKLTNKLYKKNKVALCMVCYVFIFVLMFVGVAAARL
jgi:hypothetical protein